MSFSRSRLQSLRVSSALVNVHLNTKFEQPNIPSKPFNQHRTLNLNPTLYIHTCWLVNISKCQLYVRILIYNITCRSTCEKIRFTFYKDKHFCRILHLSNSKNHYLFIVIEDIIFINLDYLQSIIIIPNLKCVGLTHKNSAQSSTVRRKKNTLCV